MRRSTCRLCGSPSLRELFSLGEQAISDFPAQPTVGVVVPIDIVECGVCTLVQQRYTAPCDYKKHYWYRSGTTATMRTALADIWYAAESAVVMRRDDVVLDIGANDGTLLSNFKNCIRVACEPAANLHAECRQHCDVLIGDLWSAELYKHGPAKIVTAIGMFYDLEDPNAFIRDVAEVLHPEGIFIAQLQCLVQTVRLGDVGNFAHEHLEFYTLASLEYLFSAHGLTICDVEENDVNGGSYRLFVAHRGSRRQSRRVAEAFEREAVLLGPDWSDAFYHRIRMERALCMQALRDAEKPLCVYGASTKGNVILQWYGVKAEFAIDRSPEKVGRFTANGIPIVSEEEGRRRMPKTALVLPYAFIDEFVEREKSEAWRLAGGKFIVSLPETRVC